MVRQMYLKKNLWIFDLNAKFILNWRRNLDDCYESMQKTCLQVFDWPAWALSWSILASAVYGGISIWLCKAITMAIFGHMGRQF